MPKSTETATKSVTEVSEAKPVAQEEPMAQEAASTPLTLPTLMGSVTEDLLNALQGNDAGAKQQMIASSIRRFRIWYDAQPVDGRKELARVNRKTMENFKLVAEQFFQEMVAISAQDI